MTYSCSEHNPGTIIPRHYHHHLVLLDIITYLIDARRAASFSTTLHKLRGHTNIRGNDLADAAARMVVQNFATLPQEQMLRVDVGANAPRPPYWVMYTAKPPLLGPDLAPGTTHTAFHRPWIPEADRLQIHAFARQSQQLRLKVKDALIRKLISHLRLSTPYNRQHRIGGTHQIGTWTKHSTKGSSPTQRKASPFSNSYTASYKMANSPKDMNTLRRTNVRYVTKLTLAHISPENAWPMMHSESCATMRRVNWCMPLSVKLQREAVPSTRRLN
jgi:hypothetical protein